MHRCADAYAYLRGEGENILTDRSMVMNFGWNQMAPVLLTKLWARHSARIDCSTASAPITRMKQI